MPVVTNKKDVLAIYKEARIKKWVLPCFCSENLTTTEAILDSVKEFGDEIGDVNLPVIIAITNQYNHRTQSKYYTNTRRWDIGLKLFLEDIKILTEKNSPYEKLRVMVHLDHTQFDNDKELLKWDMKDFSSIMFDASKVSFDKNIELTKEFVEKHGNEIVVEGACDEIVDAKGNEKSELTTAKKAEEYLYKTKVDLIVANLGTEHRASGKDLKYYSDYAKKIKDKLGTKIVLHGASSVNSNQLGNLFNDGICKVNIWTTLERDSTPILFKQMVKNASKIAGENAINELIEEGFLSEKCRTNEKGSIKYFTTEYRQNIIFNEMKKIVREYLNLWYK